MPGKLTDGFDVQVDGPAGKQAVKNARLASALAGVVTIRLNPDTITVPVTSVTVTNRISKQVSSFAFAPAPLTVSVPGTTAAPRIVELLDLKENSTWLLAGQFDVVDSPDGPGNLVLHIQGGTFEAGEGERHAARGPGTPPRRRFRSGRPTSATTSGSRSRATRTRSSASRSTARGTPTSGRSRGSSRS